MILRSFWAQCVLLLVFLVCIRGSEGFGVPVSLDVNDTIVFSEILTNPAFPPDSIARVFAHTNAGVGLAFLPTRVMHAAGLVPATQFFILYLAQMAMLALGAVTIFRAFNRHPAFVLLAGTLAFLSVFTAFGRYLAISGGFKIVSSTFAMACGFAVVGLFLCGRYHAAACAAALLAAYHPSHGVALLALIGGYAVWRYAVNRAWSLARLLRLGAVTGMAVLPFVVFVLVPLPAAQPFDPAAWWSYVFSKTSNLTPLQDGVQIVACIWGALLFGLAAHAAPRSTHDGESGVHRRAVAVIVAVICLSLLQILATEVLHSIPITQLALTRTSPYAVMMVVAILAERIFRAIQAGDATDRWRALFFGLGAVGGGISSNLPLVGLPMSLPPLRNISWLSMAAEQAGVTLFVAALAWWCWEPFLEQERRRKVLAALTGAVLLWVVVFGVRPPTIAVTIAVVLWWKPTLAPWLIVRPIAAFALIGFAALMVVLGRNSWLTPAMKKDSALISAVTQHVPVGGMVITVPPSDSRGDKLIPSRATYVGWGEGQYLIYQPSLVATVTARLATLGVYPVDQDPACDGWLFKPMCRRQLFAAKAREKNDAWRGRLDDMRQLAPSLTHALVQKSFACAEDVSATVVDDLLLIPLEGLASPGCTPRG